MSSTCNASGQGYTVTPQISIIDASMVRCFWIKLWLTAEFVKHLAPQRRRRTNGWDLPFDPQRHRRDWSLVAGFLGEKHRSKTCHMRSLRGDPLVPILLGSWRFFCSGLRLGVWISHDGSMVLLYMVTWIPSIYPLYVSIYTSTMDPSWVWGWSLLSSGWKSRALSEGQPCSDWLVVTGTMECGLFGTMEFFIFPNRLGWWSNLTKSIIFQRVGFSHQAADVLFLRIFQNGATPKSAKQCATLMVILGPMSFFHILSIFFPTSGSRFRSLGSRVPELTEQVM